MYSVLLSSIGSLLLLSLLFKLVFLKIKPNQENLNQKLMNTKIDQLLCELGYFSNFEINTTLIFAY